MRSRIYVVAVIVFTIGIFGAVGPVMATPDEAQKLRGLEGRVFQVQVQNLTTGEPPFQNCYYFLEDGTWIDPPFPVPGTWVQHTNGAATTFTAEAFFEFLPFVSLTLVQEGEVTPAQGSGVLQFEASTWVTGFFVGNAGEIVDIDWEYLSVGFQNNDCTVPPP